MVCVPEIGLRHRTPSINVILFLRGGGGLKRWPAPQPRPPPTTTATANAFVCVWIEGSEMGGTDRGDLRVVECKELFSTNTVMSRRRRRRRRALQCNDDPQTPADRTAARSPAPQSRCCQIDIHPRPECCPVLSPLAVSLRVALLRQRGSYPRAPYARTDLLMTAGPSPVHRIACQNMYTRSPKSSPRRSPTVAFLEKLLKREGSRLKGARGTFAPFWDDGEPCQPRPPPLHGPRAGLYPARNRLPTPLLNRR